MSLSSALFSGISGLSTLGNSMTVIGDNIANVNTVGFKSSRVTFQDVLSQTVATTAGTAQVGRGTSLADITSSFSQGSFESTDSTTDLAIGGEGFFIVRDPDSANNEFYTRAGEFSFDQDGNLVNPAGYIVQGWTLNETTGEDEGSIGDITLSSFTSSPSETDTMTMITNLDSDVTSSTADLSDSTTGCWDGTATTPIQAAAYDYQSTVKVYDSLGSTHDITVYYDRTSNVNEWEYIITCDPSDDQRTAANSEGLGLLARGTLTFDNNGTITGTTMEIYDGDGTTGTWSAASLSSNGYYQFEPTFSDDMQIEFDTGTRYNSTTSAWEPQSLATTQYSSASATTFQSADGYGAGALQSVTVATDGAITGQYSNGEVIPLFRVACAKFQNEQALYKEGGNLFRETRLSGDPITGQPGTNGLGSISPNSLEQSNVDIATEFVKMITTQRGFQANSKIITVTDQMLSELIALKR
jgi:flagellar hook protein FlgE